MNRAVTQKITPFLWFDSNAEEAAKFYTSVFKNSRIIETSRYGEATSQAAGKPKGSVLTVTFELEGQRFMALNGGPVFNPAISLFVSCETQEEVDELWDRLTEGGQEVECGWLTDKFGVSWQIVPSIMGEIIHSKDARRAENAMKAMLQMKKLDMAALKKAYEE